MTSLMKQGAVGKAAELQAEQKAKDDASWEKQRLTKDGGATKAEKQAAREDDGWHLTAEGLRMRREMERMKAESEFIETQYNQQDSKVYIKDSAPRAVEENDEVDSDDSWMNDSDDPELAKIQRARLEQLKQDAKRIRSNLHKGYGAYHEYTEKELIHKCAKENYCVVHFYHENFERCKVLDKHLREIAPKHLDTLFMKVEARKAAFLVEKFKVKTLPTTCVFVDQEMVAKFIGFDEFGGVDDFKSIHLVKRLIKTGVIVDFNGKRLKKAPRTSTILFE